MARVIIGIIVISNIIIDVIVIRRATSKLVIVAKDVVSHTRNGSLIRKVVNEEVNRAKCSLKTARDRTEGKNSWE